MSPEFLKVTGQDTQEDAVGREECKDEQADSFFSHWALDIGL